MKRYVTIDKETGEVILSLPDHATELGPEAAAAIQEAFAFEGLNETVLADMNAYLVSWLADRGHEVEGATR